MTENYYPCDREFFLLVLKNATMFFVHNPCDREDLYPQSKQFKPERFIERQFTHYEFLPFCGGNRRCIGYALALLEMKLVLAKIVTRWDLSLTVDSLPKRRGAIAPDRGVPLKLNGKRSQIPSNLVAADMQN